MTRLPPGEVRPATWATSLVELAIVLMLSTVACYIAAGFATNARPHGSSPNVKPAIACSGSCAPDGRWEPSRPALPSFGHDAPRRPVDPAFHPGLSRSATVATVSTVTTSRAKAGTGARTKTESAPSRRTHHVLSGVATWHATGRDGLYAAAGPLLRAALGRRWRGMRVSVCSSGRCVRVTLNDVCWCPKGRRLVDLSDEAFARLAPLGRGVISIEVRR